MLLPCAHGPLYILRVKVSGTTTTKRTRDRPRTCCRLALVLMMVSMYPVSAIIKQLGAPWFEKIEHQHPLKGSAGLWLSCICSLTQAFMLTPTMLRLEVLFPLPHQHPLDGYVATTSTVSHDVIPSLVTIRTHLSTSSPTLIATVEFRLCTGIFSARTGSHQVNSFQSVTYFRTRDSINRWVKPILRWSSKICVSVFCSMPARKVPELSNELGLLWFLNLWVYAHIANERNLSTSGTWHDCYKYNQMSTALLL